MEGLRENYRGHAIVTIVSGPNPDAPPFVASYSVWEIEPNNSHEAVLQGYLSPVYLDSDTAREAATLEAREKLDAVLDSLR